MYLVTSSDNSVCERGRDAKRRRQGDSSVLLVTSAAERYTRELSIRENEVIKNVYCNWYSATKRPVSRVRSTVPITAVTLIRPSPPRLDESPARARFRDVPRVKSVSHLADYESFIASPLD